MNQGAGEGPPPFPRIVARRLATSGLAGDLLSGSPAAIDLFGPAAGPVTREVALEPADFRSCSSGAATKLARILGGDGVLVTTGQQPGLFLGPLYSLYKALTAVRVAEQLEAQTGRPALASFWIASDDHDWDEVATCRVLDDDERLRELRLDPPSGREKRSVGTSPLPEAVVGLLEVLRTAGQGPVAGAPRPWFDVLCEAYRPGRSFSDAFGDAFTAAADGLDLVLIDSAGTRLPEKAASLYARIAAEPSGVLEAMEKGRAAVERAGYAPALTPPEGGIQLFHDDGEARRHVLFRGDGFEVRSDRIAPDELAALIRDEPEAFSPAAALRPVLESALLPVAATVLGPGEIAYWAQLRPMFDHFGVSMPRIVPRDSWTLVEPRVDTLLAKLGADVETVEGKGTDLDAEVVAAARPPAVREAVAGSRDAADSSMDALEAATARELPGLRSAAGKARHAVEEALSEFEATVDRDVARREGILLAQAARARAHLAPGGSPQERVLAAAPYLARYGAGLALDLLEASRVAGAGDQD